MRLLCLVFCFQCFCKIHFFQGLTQSPAEPNQRFPPQASRLAAWFTEVFSTLAGPWQPPLRWVTPGALYPDSAKCHTKLQQDAYQQLLLVLIPMCYWSSNSVHSEVQVFVRFTYHSSRTGGEKDLVLRSLSQLFQAGEHQYRVQLLIIPSLIHCSNTSSLKKPAHPRELKLPALDVI